MKNKTEEKPKVTEKPVSNVRSYFTKEINDAISEMTPKEMESLMKDLVNTRHWIAILKYTSMRMPLLDATLRGTDPSKEPSKISWAQGAMAGIGDIEGYVIDLNSEQKAAPEEDEHPETRVDGVIM